MNPFIRDQITVLRESNDPRDHSQATIMEMLCAQDTTLDEIKTQTTRTNGRVTRLEELASKTIGRVVDLERPAGEIKTVCKVIGKAAAIAVILVGLATGFVTILGTAAAPTKEEVQKIVDQAVADKKAP